VFNIYHIHVVHNHQHHAHSLQSQQCNYAPNTKWDCTHIWIGRTAILYPLCFGPNSDAISIATESSHLTRQHVE